jgi:hypothetical protein
MRDKKIYQFFGITHNKGTGNYECEQIISGNDPSHALVKRLEHTERILLVQAGFDMLENSPLSLLSYGNQMEEIANQLNNKAIQESGLVELLITKFEKTARYLPEQKENRNGK